MKNKKLLVLFSTILIIIFHLWISLTHSSIESYLVYMCFIGVDIFFFVSGASMVKDYKHKDLLKNRFINIYLKFILFSIIYVIYKSLSIIRLIGIISGYELFIKGGGSFLWFIPAIMILYLLVPLYKKYDSKISLIVLIICWLLFTILVSSLTSYNDIFIFTNRLPIFFLGYYLTKNKLLDKLYKNKLIYYLLSIILLIIGILISYYIYSNRITSNYINDLYYLTSIPLIVGLILLIDSISSNKIIDKLSICSLESYGIQMIFGFKIAGDLFKLIKNPLITNILVIIVILTISYIVSSIYNYLINIKRHKS